MNWPAFWNGFFKGVAAPCALLGMFSPEYNRRQIASPKVDLDEILAELDELIPPKTIKDDMAAVYGDFVRVLDRM